MFNQLPLTYNHSFKDFTMHFNQTCSRMQIGRTKVFCVDCSSKPVTFSIVPGIFGSEKVWTSGSDMIEEANWQWFLIDKVRFPVNYTNWGTGRPNNIGGNRTVF